MLNQLIPRSDSSYGKVVKNQDKSNLWSYVIRQKSEEKFSRRNLNRKLNKVEVTIAIIVVLVAIQTWNIVPKLASQHITRLRLCQFSKISRKRHDFGPTDGIYRCDQWYSNCIRCYGDRRWITRCYATIHTKTISAYFKGVYRTETRVGLTDHWVDVL